MPKIRKLALLSLILLTSLSPLSFSNISVHSEGEDEYCEEDENGYCEGDEGYGDDSEAVHYQEWTENKTIDQFITIEQNKTIDQFITIEQNETLVIKKGVEITFENGGGLFVSGNLEIRGTVKEPVKIKKAPGEFNYEIDIWDGGKAKLKNVDISGGGSTWVPMLWRIFLPAKPLPASMTNIIRILCGMTERLKCQEGNLKRKIAIFMITRPRLLSVAPRH